MCGRAGTGKTSVLKVFLKGLEELEGKRPILLLAPTGKARVRLMDRTKRDDGSVRDAYTIHQFLMRHNWLNPENFALKLQGGDQHGAPTVIIDEASMIPMDLLGVLFRALDLNKVSRLILVGDPNQLPPIGPGRPLVDIIAWLEADDERKKCSGPADGAGQTRRPREPGPSVGRRLPAGRHFTRRRRHALPCRP